MVVCVNPKADDYEESLVSSSHTFKQSLHFAFCGTDSVVHESGARCVVCAAGDALCRDDTGGGSGSANGQTHLWLDSRPPL